MQKSRKLEWIAGSKTPAKVYITRVFNFGTWEEWQNMKRRFPKKLIRETALHPLRGQWTPRGKAFAETIFDSRLPDRSLISYEV